MSTEAFLIPIETDEHQSPLALADAAILERWEFSEAGDPARSHSAAALSAATPS